MVALVTQDHKGSAILEEDWLAVAVLSLESPQKAVAEEITETV
jgi:hypothetical protein